MKCLLKPMTNTDFLHFRDKAIVNYAHENTLSGRWLEQEALERSQETYRTLLPLGIKTENNHFYNIVKSIDEVSVGMLWFAIEEESCVKTAFIYNVEINAAYRRKGYARQALTALEGMAIELGVKRVGLHVFQHNRSAQSLYESLGYQVVSSNRVKSIG